VSTARSRPAEPRGAGRRVCVVGAGGREHALARALACHAEVVVTPGNPGMAGAGAGGYGIEVSSAPPEEVEADLFVIGPEAPLVAGLADRLRARGRTVLGPGADGARLEGSKAFMKALLVEAGVATARHRVCADAADARAYLRSLPGPWVVKTDGLAAGKGVLVTSSLREAEADAAAKLDGSAFGAAGRRVVIEEGLEGPECSLTVLCDGSRVVPLALAQDHKRLADGDQGPNTGGMGAYAPLPWVSGDLAGRLVDEAVRPLVAALVARGIEYRGVLYAGLMLTPDGPRVLEYNVRLGDPEAQVLLPLVSGDLVGLLRAAAQGRLDLVPEPSAGDGSAVCVVLAAAGYPDHPRAGDPIRGLGPDGQLADPVPGATVLHAGVARDPSGEGFVTAGGRVLAVTGEAATVRDARRIAYDAVERISFAGMQVRHDIAHRALDPAGSLR